jgi:hypothetical protein
MDARRDARLGTISGGTSGSDVDAGRPQEATPEAPGWYRDPGDASKQRFWDGTAWSAAISAGTVATQDSVPHLLAG